MQFVAVAQGINNLICMSSDDRKLQSKNEKFAVTMMNFYSCSFYETTYVLFVISEPCDPTLQYYIVWYMLNIYIHHFLSKTHLT